MLNELEKAKVEQFCADEPMMSAVKKVLLAALYSHGVVGANGEVNPLINGAFGMVSLAPKEGFSDEVLGQNLRAQFAGVSIVENAYDAMKLIKTGEVVDSSVDNINPGI